MKKTLLLVLLPMSALFGVAGCDDGYSAALIYPLRTDPIKKREVGFETQLPDRPGQLPLLNIAEISNVHNPFHDENNKKNLVEAEFFIDPMMASSGDRAEIQKTLEGMFGTPAEPKVGPMSDEDRKTLQLVEGAGGNLVKGAKLYRIHCLHCHGLSGDGRGSTGRWVNPHPRDYRQGRFKFTSVDATRGMVKPNRRDLQRTLAAGIEGTAMPAFNLLTPEQRDDIISYIIHLSLRGEVEFRVFSNSFKFSKETNSLKFADVGSTVKESVMSYYPVVVKDWIDAQPQESLIKAGDYPYDSPDEKTRIELLKQSVERGKKIFENPPPKYNVGNNACQTCHKDYGRRSTFREDIWGTFSKPNNLPQGVFRGGRRPIDIYYRIHSGITPSGMIAFSTLFQAAQDKEFRERRSKLEADLKGKDAELVKAVEALKNEYIPGKSEYKPGAAMIASDAIWDLVNFVQVLGNPTMRRELGILID